MFLSLPSLPPKKPILERDTVRPQFRTFHHQLSYLIDLSDASFARRAIWRARFIIESGMPFLRPTFEHFIHPMARRLQIGANTTVPLKRFKPRTGTQAQME